MSVKASPTRPVPLRTCIGCGKETDKRALMRVVRTPAGGLEVDGSGKMPGRGAYLCREPGCWQRALKRRQLTRALRVSLSPQDEAKIVEAAQRLGILQPTAKQEKNAK